jgi:type VI secretion system secreted protein VgrG
MTLAPVQASLESDDLAGAEVAVLSADWREPLGRPFRARAELFVRIADYDGAALVGKDAALVLERAGTSRRLSGVVSAVVELGPVEPAGVKLALELEPALGLLAHRSRSRVFQDQTALEIVESVLTEELGVYGRAVRNDAKGSYARRELCVQYQESDLAFVTRLCEEEGLFIELEQGGATEVAVLRDGSAGLARVAGGDAGTLRYHPQQRLPDNEEMLFDARLRGESTATRVATRGYDFTAVTHREGSDEDQGAYGPLAERYEHGHGYAVTLADFAGGRYGAHDAAQRAKVWRESVGSPRVRLYGQSVVIGMTAGQVFDLVEHPFAEANAGYLVVECTHRFTQRERGGGAEYVNELVAQPLDRPFRLARVTPRPEIHGVETAFVVGPAGEEIHPEEHGRVRVQFHWDREGASDERSTCWVRAAQPWAGAGWGFEWMPRIGMEALVAFEDGDPDRPLVLETVYDGDHTPPYALPDEKTKSTIKSSSSLGGGGFNEWRFEDAAGSEEVYWHAQRNLDEVVLANHSTHVGADQRNEVDRDQRQQIDGDQVETVGTTQTVEVGGNRRVVVQSGFEEEVAGAETRVVQVGSSEQINGPEKHTVKDGGLVELITGKETRTVTGGLSETITSHNGFIATGPVTETISATMLRKAASITMEASASITATGTAGITVNGGPLIAVKSPQWLRLSARHEEVVTNQSDADSFKISIFPNVVELAVVKTETNKVSAEAVGMKMERVDVAIGIAQVSVSIVGLKEELSGAEMKNTPIKIFKSGQQKKN